MSNGSSAESSGKGSKPDSPMFEQSYEDGFFISRIVGLDRLKKLCQQTVEWSGRWFFSRDIESLLAVLPVVLTLLLFGAVAAWGLDRGDLQSVRQLYLTALSEAATAGNVAGQEVCLRQLCSLAPRESAFPIRLADLLITVGRVEEALTITKSLAPTDADGFADVRLWLVRNSTSAKPPFPMTHREIVIQLQRAVQEAPNNPDAAVLLSQRYCSEKEWQLAERCLIAASRLNPQLNLQLLELQYRIRRPPEVLASTARLAVQRLQEEFRRTSGVRPLLALADALRLSGESEKARKLLEEHYQASQDPEVAAALAGVLRHIARQYLEQSIAHRDRACALVIDSINRDPSSGEAVDLLLRLRRLGACIKPDFLKTAVTSWRQRHEDATGEWLPRVRLAELYLLSGNARDGAALLSDGIEQHADQRILLAELLTEAKSPTEASAVLEQIVRDAEARLRVDPARLATRVQLADAFRMLRRSEEASALFLELQNEKLLAAVRDSPAALTARGLAYVAEFDRICGLRIPLVSLEVPGDPVIPASVPVETLIKMLLAATESDTAAVPAIDRLARLVIADGVGAAEAEQTLTNLRVEGRHSLLTLNSLSARALSARKYDRSVVWLEVADALARGQNPIILNNLAVAMVRSTPPTPERALDYVERSLTLLPENPDLLSTRAEVYLARNNLRAAIADLEKSIQVRPDRPGTHRLLATTYEATGKADLARHHHEEAVRLERERQLARYR
ncbi:MAG: tetratricopeptide repeat protein [Planctomycetota bacterium]